jgi:phage-related protein
MSWSVVFVGERAQAELDALPSDARASFQRIVDLIRVFGLEYVREPHIEHVVGRLWEMRWHGKDGIARSIYMAVAERRIVVLRACVRKARTMPWRDLELALRRARDIP